MRAKKAKVGAGASGKEVLSSRLVDGAPHAKTEQLTEARHCCRRDFSILRYDNAKLICFSRFTGE